MTIIPKCKTKLNDTNALNPKIGHDSHKNKINKIGHISPKSQSISASSQVVRTISITTISTIHI